MSQKKGCFYDIRLFVMCYGLLYLTDIMAGLLKKSSLTTIERRFDLPTTIIALLASSFQIGNLTMLIFVSYFGSRWNRPRTIFFGAILLALGNVIMTLPQFIGGRYEYDEAIKQNGSSSTVYSGMCADSSNENTPVNCEESEKTPTNQLYILLVIGQMLNGVGGTPLQPLGISYIDDFAHERNSPFYIGLTTAAALLGPMFGYIMSSVVLKIWVDVGWVDTSEVTIEPTHPSWVGAWWLGLLICTSGIFITLIPFWFFPKTLEKQQYKSKKKSIVKVPTDEKPKEVPKEERKDDEPEEEKKLNIKSEFKGMLLALKRFMKNKLYVLVIIKFFFSSASMVAVVNFFPKYLEVMFGVSASRASFLTGVINMPCLVVGILCGSFSMKRLNLSIPDTAKLIAIATSLATLFLFPMAFVGCDSIDVAGITVPYADSPSAGELPVTISECNMDCQCKDGVYTPVCGADGISYISPCHAGCRGSIVDDKGAIKNFTDCACINPFETNSNDSSNWAVSERCEFSKCPNLLLVALGLKSAASFFGGVASTPIYVFMIRFTSQSATE